MGSRQFSRQFKIEAVRLVHERGGSAVQAAWDRDVHENVLRKWVRDVAADPRQRRSRVPLQGDIPNPANPSSGRVFRALCPRAIAECAQVIPPLVEVAPGHFKVCIHDSVS